MRNLFFTAFLLLPLVAVADSVGARPDGHGPISVMAEHIHKKGEWMLSYRYMGMAMAGNRSGDERISQGDAFDRLAGGPGMANMKVLPIDMRMDMHMLGVMYAPSNEVTLMLMVPYTTIEMDHRVQMMGNVVNAFEAQTSGIGDIAASALVNIYKGEDITAHLNLGLSVPSGAIDKKDDTPMGRQQLPYPMQLGGGSYEFHPGITVLGRRPNWSWGAQANAKFALDENSQGYRLGDGAEVTGWLARRVHDGLSLSLLARKSWWNDILGEAEDLDISGDVNPAADTGRQAGQRLDVGVGFNVIGRTGAIKDHRLAVEYLVPIQQSLNGPRLEMDSVLAVGWQKAFGG